ncbi:hypothetical protein FB45DRAFT_1001573 [Roridomyces roridus]|uniref:Zn(2)-C6 fungal-type domain-containing protein n=1 Tax=Roridomyces roridus TaxID=1738132 RepID=A0AAD7FS97_9AGAR|nr:hypothetical protein FB45DRAFT_1001573 [Roridomyces roridus]
MSVSHVRPLSLSESTLNLNRLAPIRLPSYKELTAASNCDDSFPGPSSRSRASATALIRLPPLEVPSTPRAIPNEKTRDRFLDLAARCPPPNNPAASSSPPSRAIAQDTRSFESERILHPSAAWGQSGVASTSNNWPRVPLPCPARDATPRPAPPPPSSTNRAIAPSSSPATLSVLGHIRIAPASPTEPSNSSADIPAYKFYSTLLPTQPLKFSHANAKAEGRGKKQALSCYFCRERKIACGRPEGGVGACNQCVRRKQMCTYPTVSHRGQHSRIRSAARRAGVREVDMRHALLFEVAENEMPEDVSPRMSLSRSPPSEAGRVMFIDDG